MTITLNAIGSNGEFFKLSVERETILHNLQKHLYRITGCNSPHEIRFFNHSDELLSNPKSYRHTTLDYLLNQQPLKPIGEHYQLNYLEITLTPKELQLIEKLRTVKIHRKVNETQHLDPEHFMSPEEKCVLSRISDEYLALLIIQEKIPYCTETFHTHQETIPLKNIYPLLSPDLKTNPHIALHTLKQQHKAFHLLPQNLKTDRDFILQAVKKSGMVFKHLSKRFKTDREIVLAAVKNDPRAFLEMHPQENFYHDTSVVQAALTSLSRIYTFQNYKNLNVRSVLVNILSLSGNTANIPPSLAEPFGFTIGLCEISHTLTHRWNQAFNCAESAVSDTATEQVIIGISNTPLTQPSHSDQARRPQFQNR